MNELPDREFIYKDDIDYPIPKKEIEKDFMKIKEYLNLGWKWKLTIISSRSDGFCYRNRKMIMIGIKDGYKRRLLIHECLHASGFSHHDFPDYHGAIKEDYYSAKIEEKIFGVPTER